MREIAPVKALAAMPKLNSLRLIIVMMIALGYTSTMPFGPVNAAGAPNPEWLKMLGYDPSWIGISLLFFLSGILATRSLLRHGSSLKYLESRFFRNAPLLFFITLIVVGVIYPLFGTVTGTPAETLKTIVTYFLGTVTCIRPGEPLPGLLDDAKYMCLIQGSIWTLKWGVLAHIAVAIGQRLQFFKNRTLVLSMSLLAILSYIVALFIHLEIRALPNSILLTTRLAWPFLVGMTVYRYWDEIPKSFGANFGISIAFLSAASLMYYVDFIPWTKAIVVCLVMAWAWLCVGILKMEDKRLRMFNEWPALALAAYLINWPVSQITLLIFPDLTAGQLIALALPITIVLSFLVHRLVSQRSFRYARSREVIITA